MIDSNVILDIVTKDEDWYGWSSTNLETLAQENLVAINSIIYAEVSIGFQKIEEVEELFAPKFFIREMIPWEASILAGKCFLAYRKKGGVKSSPLPDFFIGAHAMVRGWPLLTRDSARYRTYFPKLDLICP